MEWDRIRILVKDVRDYGGRKRINITNSDGLVKDDKVVILKEQDYNDLIAEYHRLETIESDLDNQKVTADAIGEKLVKPLSDSYDSIISDLQEQINDKDTEINRLKAVYNEYDKQVYSLGLLDILRKNNRKISDDFNSKIWITRPDSMVTDAEVKKLADGPDTDKGGADT